MPDFEPRMNLFTFQYELFGTMLFCLWVRTSHLEVVSYCCRIFKVLYYAVIPDIYQLWHIFPADVGFLGVLDSSCVYEEFTAFRLIEILFRASLIWCFLLAFILFVSLSQCKTSSPWNYILWLLWTLGLHKSQNRVLFVLCKGDKV